MYISDSELNTRGETTDKLYPKSAVVTKVPQVIRPPRHQGPILGWNKSTLDQKALSVNLRPFVGLKSAAEIAHVGYSDVRNYEKGQTSQGGPVNPELVAKINDVREPIRDRAAELVLNTLGIITDKEISAESVRTKVAIAKDLSSILEKLSPKEVGANGESTVKVLIYVPRVRDTDEYEIINQKQPA